MKNYDKQYYVTMKGYIENQEKYWRQNIITNQSALEFLEEKSKEIGFFLRSNGESSLKKDFLKLGLYVNKLIHEIKKEMKSIYILRTNKNKLIAVLDKSLVQKCIERLGEDNVKYSQMQVCFTEEDLNGVLFEKQLED